ncbi:poly-gamma-glutamate hydrolase family protein [Streptomyces cellostaticus]|uniref:poly-gamma-glutamate hydrolase family protein n=1 Tax=Streptomyces TaxID=1883 RepID=UPI002025CB72|nr:poly-gamma-glutamate hydrolase family protein [Streptomyces cellostaticus]
MEHVERVVVEGVEFEAALTVRSEIGLLALHGAKEGGTAELAHEAAARTGATVLVFTQPTGSPVHIPSHRMSAAPGAALRTFLSHVSLAVSLHGHLRPGAARSIFLGGANREAALVLGRPLALLTPAFDTVTDLELIPAGLRGLDPRNPVNLTRAGGVQVELPLAARTSRPWKTRGAPETPPRAVADALTAGVRELAAHRPWPGPPGSPGHPTAG